MKKCISHQALNWCAGRLSLLSLHMQSQFFPFLSFEILLLYKTNKATKEQIAFLSCIHSFQISALFLSPLHIAFLKELVNSISLFPLASQLSDTALLLPL